MSTRYPTIAMAIAMTLSASVATAADLNDRFSVRGYGTLGVTHSDNDEADYITMPLTQDEGPGHSEDWSYGLDSKFGVQLDVKLTERLSAVVQLVSEGAYNNSWDGDANDYFMPSLEWANLSYELTDEVTVRAGRIVLPVLMVAEFRKVGYAQHWIRPPADVYQAPPFTSSDGADISYRKTLSGGVINTLRGHYGVQSLRAKDTADVQIKSQVVMWGVNDTVEVGALTVRAAYMNAHFEATGEAFAPLFDAYSDLVGNFGPQGQAAAALARSLNTQFNPSERQKVEVYDVGFSYDPGQWLMSAELNLQRSDQLLGDALSGFISGGYRLGSFTPFATISRYETKSRSARNVPMAIAGAPPMLAGPIAGLGGAVNGVVNGIVGADHSSQTLALGARWDFYSNFALKVQYDMIDLDEGSSGTFINLQPGFEYGGRTNLFSVALDYTF